MPPRTQGLPAIFGRNATASPASSGSTLRRAQRLQKLPHANRILGIDPGLHRTGYGLIETGNAERGTRNSEIQIPHSAVRTPRLVEGGILTAKASDALCERLQTLHTALTQVLEEGRPDVVVIEELFSTYAHPRSALLMAHARGVLMLAAQQAGVRVHHFLPNEVKQVIAGNGHATKEQVQTAVRARLRLSEPLEPPDVADALALALCFAARQEVSGRLG